MNEIKTLFLEILPQIEHFGILLLKALVFFCIGLYLSFFLRKKVVKLLSKKDEILANFIAQVAFVLTLIITAIIALSSLGVQTTSIITVLGTAGIAVALALKDSLSSIAGGIILIVLRPFKKGDTVELSGLNGKVESVNLFNTSLRLHDGRLAILPNKSVANSNIVNSNNSECRRIEWICGVGYGSDVEIVRKTIKEVIDGMEKIDKSMPTFVGITDFGSSSLNFTIRAWAKIEDGIFNVRSELIERVKNALDANHIEIPFNKLDISITNQDSLCK
ncbi:small-conductance mechanosensitive channel MscS [Helicobacter mustelae]|uniref:Putative mechanosensitive ion channel n=1 Tax=Helicobacter mustelae (strain ATCC 43772 / CCUG 25715 / CIP 103759 / LMG 18044 / NCTC 12198 / R85-136P) TaxID=679897 RepID=D3UJL4_HELM1|nr:mechanosensitive ion channel family protein [Helicobacter mustelae]CBG40691.1 putative mechanosensitive ion channel [Helicobacter mustelae 12198]SQH72189.1 mechanosensitive ion channel [Helicobacter mustelae]STP13332.1 mechanosensitive ion channel [Helicobacter mustelae]